MTAPRLLSPFVRTRTRLACTLGLLSAVLVAALLPFWYLGADEPRARQDGATAIEARDEAAARTEARRVHKEVLVDTATTDSSQTWALPSGLMRTQIHALPQRAKNAEGRWAAIDTTLIRAENAPDGLGVRPANAPTPVRFSSGGAAAGRTDASGTVLAEVDTGGHTIAYTWPGPLPEPVLDGPRALYPEVLPGADLLIVAREAGGFGQMLIVKNRSAATIRAASALTYGLRSATAVFRHDATTGGVRIVDRVSGEEISSIPTPFAWDSAGRNPEALGAAPRTSVATPSDVLKLSGLHGSEPGARQAPIPTRLDGNGTGDARLSLNAAATGLLTDADAHFPVFLDPAINPGTLVWASVHKQYPNTNTYNGTNFNNGTTDARVGHENETGLTSRSFWRMGFSSSLKGATVTSANLKVLNNHSWDCTKREMQLWLTGAISSGTTWNKQPSWSAIQEKKSFAHGYGSKCAEEYVSFDVLDGAKVGASKGASNLTFGMRATDENDTNGWRRFKATSAVMEVEYNRPPNEPKNGTTSPGGVCKPGPGNGVTVAKTNIVLSATATDADGNLKGLRFRFWKNGAAAPAGTLVTSLSSGKASLTIPSTTLQDKVTYSWDVRAEDELNAVSGYFPPGNEPCRITVDATAPPAPDVSSEVFKEATPDGATWATVKFGETGSVTFAAEGSAKFSYAFGALTPTYVPAVSGIGTVPDLAPRHSGPNSLLVFAYDAAGNRSVGTYYTFYLPPRDTADGPGDTGGDGRADLVIINAAGNLETLPGDEDGELFGGLAASYSTGDKLHPAGHWWDEATGKAALITKHSDAYPGDGTTDLFARTPDGGFWLYPGDGYGSFNVDQRLRILLPSNVPDPATWTQIKAVGDITGDKLPDLVLRAGTAFWALTGYTGASFQQATLMEGTAWARQEIVNVADVDLDGTPDLLWRHLDTGTMYLRHGKPGPVAGSVNLDSLKTAANSRQGDVRYGTGWAATSMTAVLGIPDVNGDKVPDLWVRRGADGNFLVYHPSTTDTNPMVKVVLGVDWSGIKAFA